MILDREEAIRIGAVFLAFCVSLFFVLSALARDDGRYASSPHKEWFKSQHNSLGEWCCDNSDGHLYYGDYTINQDGSVTVEGETIPKEKVLRGPNPTGAAVWWKLGSRTYCFSVGSGA